MSTPSAPGAGRAGGAQANGQLGAPADQEIRCALGALRATVFGRGPVAVLGLTAASNAALVGELFVRFAGLVETDTES